VQRVWRRVARGAGQERDVRRVLIWVCGVSPGERYLGDEC
jgi:hypothetical protein